MATAALLSQILALPQPTRVRVLSQLSPQDQSQIYLALRYDWPLWARPK